MNLIRLTSEYPIEHPHADNRIFVQVDDMNLAEWPLRAIPGLARIAERAGLQPSFSYEPGAVHPEHTFPVIEFRKLS